MVQRILRDLTGSPRGCYWLILFPSTQSPSSPLGWFGNFVLPIVIMIRNYATIKGEFSGLPSLDNIFKVNVEVVRHLNQNQIPHITARDTAKYPVDESQDANGFCCC